LVNSIDVFLFFLHFSHKFPPPLTFDLGTPGVLLFSHSLFLFSHSLFLSIYLFFCGRHLCHYRARARALSLACQNWRRPRSAPGSLSFFSAILIHFPDTSSLFFHYTILSCSLDRLSGKIPHLTCHTDGRPVPDPPVG
jgi:hypothetical protein